MTHTLTTDAAWLNDTIDVLYATRHKGTPRPWRETDLTPQARQQMAARAKAERHRRPHLKPGLAAFLIPTIPPSGDSASPLHLDVLDLTRDIHNTARTAAIQIALTKGDTLTLVHVTRRATTHAALTYITTHGGDADPNDPATITAATNLHNTRIKAARHFQEIIEGQRLKTDCPWCGRPRMFFRTIGPNSAPELVVRCDSGTCQPPDKDCGTWHRGRPCWPLHEWEWLSQRIDHHTATNPKRHAETRTG